jgi:hypothetical protein
MTMTAQRFFARPFVHWVSLSPMLFLFAAGVLILATGGSGELGGVFIGLAVVLTLLIYLPFVFRIRLHLTPQGVCARAPLCHLETPWSNIERLYRCGKQAGFVTREPLTGKGPARLADTRDSYTYCDPSEAEWIRLHRYIPLRGFEHAVKSGAVERAVAAWGAGVPVEESPPPAPVRIPLKLWLLIAALILLGFALTLLPESASGPVLRILQVIGLTAGAVGTGAHGVHLWRQRSRLLSVMQFILSAVLGLLAIAALAG